MRKQDNSKQFQHEWDDAVERAAQFTSHGQELDEASLQSAAGLNVKLGLNAGQRGSNYCSYIMGCITPPCTDGC
jgi:hypothetical protein